MTRERMTRRRFLVRTAALAAGVGILGLGAQCGAPAPPTPTKPAEVPKKEEKLPAVKETITLRIQTPATDVRSEIKFAIPDFEKKYPHITVKSEETLYMEIPTKTDTGFIAGTLQDICYGHNRWYFYGCYKGIYRPVDDYIKTDPPEDFKDFFPLVMEVNKFEGKQYSLPNYVHAGGNIVIMWNKNILKDAGVKEPEAGWNMDKFKELVIKTTNKDKKIFGADWVVNAVHYFLNYTRSWGKPTLDDKSGWVLSEDGKTFLFLEPKIKEASKLYLDLRKMGCIPMTADQVEGGLFVAGRMAFASTVAGGVHTTQAKVKDKFEVGFQLLPLGPEGRQGTCFSGNHWMINSKSKYSDEAWKLICALVAPEVSLKAVLELGMQSGRKSAWIHPETRKMAPAFPIIAEVIDKGLEQFPMPWNLRFVEVNDVFQNEGDFIWNLDKTWDAHAETVQKKVQEKLNLDRPPKAAGA